MLPKYFFQTSRAHSVLRNAFSGWAPVCSPTNVWALSGRRPGCRYVHIEVNSIRVPPHAVTEKKSFRPVAENVKFPGSLDDSSPLYFPSAETASQTSPLASKLFEVDGVSAITLKGSEVIIRKSEGYDWEVLQPSIVLKMAKALSMGTPYTTLVEPVVKAPRRDRPLRRSTIPAAATDSALDFADVDWSDAAAERESANCSSSKTASVEAEEPSRIDEAADDSVTLEEAIADVFEESIVPMVASDGGIAEFIRFEVATGTVFIRLSGACEGCPSVDATLNLRIKAFLQYIFDEILADATEWGTKIMPFQAAGAFLPFEKSPFDSSTRDGVSALAAASVTQASLGVVASSEGKLWTVDFNRCVAIAELKGHTAAITDVSFLAQNPNGVVSTSRDGTASVFDLRLAPSNARQMKIRLSLDDTLAECYCVDVGGSSEQLLAAGVDAAVNLYDLRRLSGNSTGKGRFHGLANVLDDVHTDVISTAQFHPLRRSLLACGADDSLISLVDVAALPVSRDANAENCSTRHFGRAEPSSQPYDGTTTGGTTASSSDEDVENDSSHFVAGIQSDSAPRSIQFVGPARDVLCTVSSTESVAAWSIPALGCVNASCRSGNEIFDFSEITAILPDDQISIVRNWPELHSDDSSGYIVDILYDEAAESLYVLGASKDGKTMRLFNVILNKIEPVANSHFDISSVAHDGLIRAALVIPHGTGQSVIISGGEDGQIILWANARNS